MRDLECRLKNCTVHYEIRGRGKPIVMLHGGGPDRRSMTGCMEFIFRNREGWRRIYPDLPGFGKTPAPEWITNSDQMLSILVVGFIMRTAAILAYNASSVEDLLSGRARGRLWPLALGNIVAGVGFIIVIFAIVIYIVFSVLGGLERSENMPTVTPEEDGDATSY